MDLKKFRTKAEVFIKKYRFVALILVIGLLFMAIPGKNTADRSETQTSIVPTDSRQPSADETLAQILQKIDGAGEVQVLLSLSKGEETLYQTDTHTSISGDTNTSQNDTVLVTSTDRAQDGLIRQINPPTYLGAIVVCQGADSPTVRLAIVDAVSKITGLGADRISVLKMK